MRSAKSSIIRIAVLLFVFLAIAVLAAACQKSDTYVKPEEHTETIYLGTYEQDNDLENGAEPIEWVILEKSGNKALILCVRGIDAVPYNEAGGDTTWETSTVRKWLNDTFYNAAFSEKEKNVLVSSEVSGGKNPEYGTSGGNITTDRIFLLSTDEAEKYYEAKNRKCIPTDYAVANGVYTLSGRNVVCWWNLRTPGRTGALVSYVDMNGYISNDGTYTQVANNAVRPAMWIDLSAYNKIKGDIVTPAPRATEAPEEEATPDAGETTPEAGEDTAAPD